MILPFGWGRGRRRRILVIGDSHCQALLQACHERSGPEGPVRVMVRRLARVKNGKKIGDISYRRALWLVRMLGPDDVLISMLGGNAYNIIGLVQHPEPFEVFETWETGPPARPARVIPQRAMLDLLETHLCDHEATRLARLRAAARCRVFHVDPPPPKADLGHLVKHETEFVKAGIDQTGVSSAALRLTLWHLQCRLMRKLCSEIGIGAVEPPREAIDENGFLGQRFYAKDATHANGAYGELVLRMLERLALDSLPGSSGKG